MDERRLRYFLAVVEDGGVTRAAARLHVAQPSLSQALQVLEAELGVQLFIRAGRRMRLSAAGEEFVGPARQALRAIDEARNTITGITQLQTGTLAMTSLATLAVDPMATLVGRFRRAYPGVQVRILEADSTDHVSAMVRDGSCELGATHLPLRESAFVAHQLGEQELLFVLPPDTQPRTKAPIRALELAETPLVVSPPDTSTRILLEHALAAAHLSPQIAVEVAAREAIVPLVLAGAGAALLPATLAQEAQRRGATIRPASPAITRNVGLIHREGAISAAAKAFLDIATEHRQTTPQS